MAKYEKLDAKAKRDLNTMCTTMGYNFPLGDWIDGVNDSLNSLLDLLANSQAIQHEDELEALKTGVDE